MPKGQRRVNCGTLYQLRCTASATKCPPVRFQVCSPVAGDVSCSDAAGLRKRQPRRHAAVSAQATSVGDELHCSAGVLIVAYDTSLHFYAAQLHWLKARERIDFKLTLLVYKCQHGAALSYLADELRQPADFEARRRLRSDSSPSLIVRRTRLSTINDRAFPVAAARVWNVCRSMSRLSIFRSSLKTQPL